MLKQAFSIDPGTDPGKPAVTPLGLVKFGAQPQPAPRPQPAPQPQPAPRPQPAPQPQPAPKPQSAPQPQPAPKPQPAPQPQPAPKPQEAIELEDELVVGKETMISCPHCAAQLKIKVPKEGKGKMQCGKCKGFIGFNAKSKTVVMPGQRKPTHTKRGRLVKVNGFLRKNDVFKLRDGKNVIGRFDHSKQSDIAIAGDGLMSRRSVEIEVTPVMGGYSFRFTILQSTNPVIYNKQECRTPYSREIRFGDTFVLGETTFRFEADD